MKIIFLGTGNALAYHCYNTCFVLEESNKYLLVDGGGGNGLFKQLEEAKIDWKQIKNIFITHKHTDHILGVLWFIRLVAQNMSQDTYEGIIHIYGHKEVISDLRNICTLLIRDKEVAWFDNRIIFVVVEDGETVELLQHKFTFFDIYSTKDKQFGFQLNYKNQLITCLGDEPYNQKVEKYVLNSDWLLLEAFCLDSQKDIFHPYEKNHVTVKDACILANKMNVKNLILYHSEDSNISQRKKMYLKEGKDYFKENLFVPDDLDVIEI